MKHKKSLMKAKTLVLLLSGLLLASCASNSRISGHQSQLDSLKREVFYLKEQNSQLRREIDNIKKQLAEAEQNSRQDKADLIARLSEVSNQMEEVRNQLQDFNSRINSLLRSGGRSSFNSQDPSFANGDTSSSQSLVEDRSRELYNTAYRDFIRGNYQLALSGFRQFIQQHPNSELVDNAQYWLGEIYYAQGRYPQAIEEFEKVVRWYPNGDKTASALLKIGYAYLSINEMEQGKLYLEEVIKEHPNSEEADLAKGRLGTLE